MSTVATPVTSRALLEKPERRTATRACSGTSAGSLPAHGPVPARGDVESLALLGQATRPNAELQDFAEPLVRRSTWPRKTRLPLCDGALLLGPRSRQRTPRCSSPSVPRQKTDGDLWKIEGKLQFKTTIHPPPGTRRVRDFQQDVMWVTHKYKEWKSTVYKVVHAVLSCRLKLGRLRHAQRLCDRLAPLFPWLAFVLPDAHGAEVLSTQPSLSVMKS